MSEWAKDYKPVSDATHDKEWVQILIKMGKSPSEAERLVKEYRKEFLKEVSGYEAMRELRRRQKEIYER
jgi:hypothetical protein